MHPSGSMTTMGGEDDAVARSARLAPWTGCTGSHSADSPSGDWSTSAGGSRLAPGGSHQLQLAGGHAPDLAGEATR